MHRKLQLHPSLVLVVGYFFITQQLYMYSLVVLSFIIHELGHILVAKLLQVKLRSLIILPFGGQLSFMPSSNSKLLAITCGGPFFTLLLLVASVLMQWHELLLLQLLLLIVNCLPIWPLDGGKILYVLLQQTPTTIHYEAFIHYSFIAACTVLIVALCLSLPIFFLFISIVLVVETFQQYRFRKFASAARSFY